MGARRAGPGPGPCIKAQKKIVKKASKSEITSEPKTVGKKIKKKAAKRK